MLEDLKMKKNTTVKQLIIIMLLAIITMVLSSCGNTSIETTTIEETTTLVNNDVKPTTFRFAAYRSGVIGEAEIYYDDSYFNIPATTLSNELTSASICLAVTGFSVVRGNDYTQSPKYAEALLTKLGFSNFESNEYGKTRPTSNSFGVYFGMKMVDDYTLIAVTTRGSNYGWEWASNLTIGEDGDFATGFYEASTIYINSLKDYISSKNITGKIKIWVTQNKVPWVRPNSYSMWAPDCVYRNGKYYFYFPSAPAAGKGFGFGIGVAIADSPEGPFIPEPEPIKGISGIDPCVLQASDGNAYIFWGAGRCAKLKPNMKEIADDTPTEKVKWGEREFEMKGVNCLKDLPNRQAEGPFAFEYNGNYYLTYPYVRENTEVPK